MLGKIRTRRARRRSFIENHICSLQVSLAKAWLILENGSGICAKLEEKIQFSIGQDWWELFDI
jgi:hypothetical protein